MPKSEPIQHEGYMAAVRKLKCAHCGWPPPSQFCHSDEGKGGAIKSDCREGWPGCGPHFDGGVMVSGCHFDIGTARIYPKQKRRDIEARYPALLPGLLEHPGIGVLLVDRSGRILAWSVSRLSATRAASARKIAFSTSEAMP